MSSYVVSRTWSLPECSSPLWFLLKYATEAEYLLGNEGRNSLPTFTSAGLLGLAVACGVGVGCPPTKGVTPGRCWNE